MNRLRLGLSAVAVIGTLAMAGCATSAPHLDNGGPAASISLPPAGPPGPSGSPSGDPSGIPTASPTSAAPATSIACKWGRSGNPADAPTGTPPESVPNTGTATMVILTNRGSIAIAIDRAATPCTIASFAYLTSRHFFDETPCHRLTLAGIYILQCGDPTGTGSGGPSYSIPDEALPRAVTTSVVYPRGTVAMANSSQPNTGGSQFFMVYKDSPLPPTYTILGTVTSGEDILDETAAGGVAPDPSGNPYDGKPELPITILSLSIIAS